MRLISPERIAEVDRFAVERLGIEAVELMRRSAESVCHSLLEAMPQINGKITVLAGAGNNGGDGYAAASILADKYTVQIFDIFGAGQRSSEGKYYLEKCKSIGIPIYVYENTEQNRAQITSSAVIIDAVLGAGARLPLSDRLVKLCQIISASPAFKLAVDVPLGIDPKTAQTDCFAPIYDLTVSLSYVKVGLVSYPAKDKVGRLVCCDLLLDGAADVIAGSDYVLIDAPVASALLPKRESNSSKGSFGKAILLVGSEKYPGAALLALESALRFGAGYVTLYGERKQFSELLSKFPEAIYVERLPFSQMEHKDILCLASSLPKTASVLVGSGGCSSDGLRALTLALLSLPGRALIIDADAINSLAANTEQATLALRSAKRKVILTPHPLEFARLIGVSLDEVQAKRLPLAEKFARENKLILVLKGAATIITDGKRTYINSSGSSALSKAGSGDCLAGAIASIAASGCDELNSAALAVYVHGAAGDSLAQEFSQFGVTPSDLPREMARVLCRLEALYE